MVVTCDIEFDNNPYGTYFAGQVLSGRITLKSDKAKQVKGIALKIKGFAHTSWSESTTHNVTNHKGEASTENRTTWFNGHEDYIASLTYVLGSDDNQSVTIEPGIRTYNFACHIPLTCPSSFEGTYGHVRYTVKVELIRPWKFDLTFMKGFTVLKMADLNYDSPILRMPTNTEVEKTFCCGPCKSKPLKLHLGLIQGGFVPGQSIPVSLLVTNDSNVPVQDFKVELVMVVCYYSQFPYTTTKNERIVVTKLKGESLQRNCKKLFNYSLLVPATPPTCFNLCRLVQIAYQVEVEAKVKGMHTNQVLCVPVTIGNVPLMSVIAQQPTSSMGMQRGFDNSAAVDDQGIQIAPATIDGNGNEASGALKMATANGATSTPTPWAADASIPPPAYEEAMHMRHAKINEGEAHDFGQSDFAPRYPVFQVPNPTAPPNDDIDHGQPNNGTWL